MMAGSADYVASGMTTSHAENEDNGIILIESESEEDQQTSERTTLRRSATSETISTVPNAMDNSQSVANTEVVLTDDGRRAGSVSPIASSAEYIDLESESTGNNEMAGDQDDMIVYDERLSAPRDNEDDEVIIVQEQTGPSTIQLNLPGRDPMHIRATQYDRPVRRSFEHQSNQSNNRLLRHSRRQASRRAARRANHSISRLNDYDRDDDELRSSTYQRIQRSFTGRDRGENQDPAFAALRRRVDDYPPNIRSAFDHAQSMNEFRSILQNVDPLTWQDCRSDLERLYMDYRNSMVRRAAQAGQSMLDYRSPQRGTDGRAGLLHNLRPLDLRIGVGSGMGESLTHYLLEHSAYGYDPYGLIANPRGLDNDTEEEARTQSILNAIQDREEQEHNARTKKNMQKTRQQEGKIVERCKNLPEGFSASFDTTPTTVRMEPLEDGNKQAIVVEDEAAVAEWEEIAVCCLCGVELGVGIPDEFTGISPEDRGKAFEQLVNTYDSCCPYQSLTSANGTERDLSKKTFVASCGHAFCGRCVVRIENARSQPKSNKKRFSELKGPLHPDNYGPKTCPGADCKYSLRSGRSRMREAFF